MTLPAARTRDEAYLYMDLHPCPRCGGGDVTWRAMLTGAGRRYEGTCGDCGQEREFVFALPERPGAQGFGGPEPSRLLDPGEWLMVADLCAQAGDRPTAVAAMDEVLTFVPPGEDAVPEAAFWSDRGRAMRDREPGRFRRARLEVIRDSYRERR